MYSVAEYRQTPGSLHHQRSKAQCHTVPSDPFLSWHAANQAVGLLSFCSSLGRAQAPLLAGWQTNRLCAQFLSAGRLLAVCAIRDLKLMVIQYLVILFCPRRQQISGASLLLQLCFSSILLCTFASIFIKDIGLKFSLLVETRCAFCIMVTLVS